MIYRHRLLLILILFSLTASLGFIALYQVDEFQTKPFYQQSMLLSESSVDEMSLLRLILIPSIPESYFDDFSAFAAIPANVFLANDTTFKAPVLLVDESQSVEYFLEDWSEYASHWGGLDEVISLGLSPTQFTWAQQVIRKKIYPNFQNQDIYSLASSLALYDWVNSSTLVVSPVTENIPTDNTTSLSHDLLFSDVQTDSCIFSGDIGPGMSVNHTLSLESSVGFLNGTLDWTPLGDGILTHTVFSPSDRIIDYSLYKYAKWQTDSTGNPLSTRFAVSEVGDWTLNITHEFGTNVSYEALYTKNPAERWLVDVPSDAIELNISLDWTDGDENVDLYLINPEGRLVSCAAMDDVAQFGLHETLRVHRPVAGSWTVMAVWMEGQGSLNVTANAAIVRRDPGIDEQLLSGANGAVIASMLNAPLLYIGQSQIPDSTNATITQLNTSNLIVVDLADCISQEVRDALTTAMNSTTYLTNYTQLVTFMSSMKNITDLSLVTLSENYTSYLCGATISSAINKAPILIPDKSLVSTIESGWVPYNYPLAGANAWEGSDTDLRLDDRFPHRYTMWDICDEFNCWIQSFGLNYSDINIVRIFSDLLSLKPTLDRALIGQYITGRLPGTSAAENMVFSVRGLFYNEVIFANSKRNQALTTFYAYAHGTDFIDNNGDMHQVYERDLISQGLSTLGLNMINHTKIEEVIGAANEGVSFWTISTHGVILETQPTRYITSDWIGLLLSKVDHPFGFDVGASVNDPDADSPGEAEHGIVNPDNTSEWETLLASELDTTLENIGSTVVTIVGCDVGGSEFPEVLLRHGAVNVIASTRSIFFDSGGWSNIRYLETITQNQTCGEALNQTITEIAEIYSKKYHTLYSDWALQFVLFGEPSINMFRSGSMEPTPKQTNQVKIDGHLPSHAYPRLAVIGYQNTITDELQNLTMPYDYYNVSTEMQLFDLKRQGYYEIIIESDSLSFTNTFTSTYTGYMTNYSCSGGVLIILGAGNADMSWLDPNLNFNTAENGTSISYTTPRHPLTSIPNDLTEDLIYRGEIVNHSNSYFILANGEDNPVWIAATTGEGKISITTLLPDLNNNTGFVENIISWLDVPFLRINQTGIPIFVSTGQPLTFTLKIIDQVYNPLEDVNVTIQINTERIQAVDQGSGNYEITIPGSHFANLGFMDITIIAYKTGYDPAIKTATIQILNNLIPDWLEPYTPIILSLFLLLWIGNSFRPSKSKPKKDRPWSRKKGVTERTLSPSGPDYYTTSPVDSHPEIQPDLIEPDPDMKRKSFVVCSLCGSSLPEGTLECPVCGNAILP